MNWSAGVYRVEDEHYLVPGAGGNTFNTAITVNRTTINTTTNINKNTTNKNSVNNCSSKKGKYCDKNNVARDDLAPVTTPAVDDLAPVTTPVVDDLAPVTTPVVDGISSPPLERFLGWWQHNSASLEASTTVTTTPASSINTSSSLADGLSGTVCGLSGRIVGGIESGVGAWPWAVLISNNHGQPYCGGTLISLRHVLTAAHCTTGKEIEKMYPISVTVGEHDLMDPSESPSQTLGVAYALFHSDFGKEAQFDNDVALLVLLAALDPRLNLMPACLPGPDYSVAGSVVTVVGWGATHEGGASSNILKEAHIPVLQESTCQTSYPGSFLPEKMICAGYLVGRTDTCQGDSGGPLTHQQDSTAPWTVVGVVSYGRGCARPGYPGVYTRLTTFLPWLTKVMDLYP